MEILGIGMPELIFVIIIALIILGPKDMQKAGKTIGKFLRNVITSDGWKIFQQTSRDLRTLPNRLMREANEDLEKITREINSSASFSTSAGPKPANSRPQPQPYSATPAPKPVTENNSIAPVEQKSKETESDSQNNA